MKKLVFVLIFLFTFLSFAQTYVEKYNSLNGRYEYSNKETGQIIAYKSYNSLNGSWEITYLAEENQNGGTYIPQKERYDENFQLLQQVMQLKQSRYDNKSYEEKARMNQIYQYNQRRRSVTKEFNKYYSQVLKDYNQFIKDGNKNYHRNKNKESENISALKDGWYECFTILNITYQGLKTPLNLKRFIEIKNNNIINYIGNNNIIYPVEESTMYSNTADFSIRPRNKPEKYTIYVQSNEPLKKVPVFYNGETRVFYTTIQNAGEIDIIIKGKQIGYIWLGKLKHYWEVGTSVDCHFGQGVISVTLPPGEYEYLATSDTKIWKNSFIVKDGMSCIATQFVN